MISALFWVIGFPFIIAFTLGFITYNLGDMSPPAKAEPKDSKPSSV